MALTSLTFLLFIVVTAAISGLIRAPLWRKTVLLLASLGFIASYAPSLLSVVPFAGFVLAGYAAVIAAKRWPSGHVASALAIAGFIGLFVWLKHYAFVAFIPALAFPYLMLGASYALFRILHLAFEIRDGAMEPPPLLDYLVYVLFFPAFLSGPINRYDGFAEDVANPKGMDRDEAFRTLGRIILGFFKVAVTGEIARILYAGWADRIAAAAAGPAPLAAATFTVAAGFYFVFLYLNFSGSMDIAIGVGRMFGIVLPENFNKPLRAANYQDFWARWHITLSNWFKAYFYNPLVKALMTRFGASRALAPYLGVIASFAVFMVLGAWHGASVEFMLSGVFYAVGVCTNQLYQVQMNKRLGKKPYKALAANPAYILVGRGMTIAFHALATSPFWLSIEQLGVVWEAIGPLGVLGAYVGLSLVVSGLCLAWDMVAAVLPKPAADAPVRPHGMVLRGAVLALAVIALVFILPLVNSPPELIYKAF